MLGELFDPKAELLIYEQCPPHWSQSGAVTFLTFRTHDSLPRSVVQRWEREKQEWLRRHGYAAGNHWSEVVPTLTEKEQADFAREFDRQRETCLDACHGRCLLRRPELAQIVSDSLLHFDGERYRMGDFIVMPNHVHLLVAFATAAALKNQCDSWLHYTAYRINQAIGEKGTFWQQEPFDHLVRSPVQYDYLWKYIAENPLKAQLGPGNYLYRRYAG